MSLVFAGAGETQAPGASSGSDRVEYSEDPLTEADLALIQAEEDQMADLALTQKYTSQPQHE